MIDEKDLPSHMISSIGKRASIFYFESSGKKDAFGDLIYDIKKTIGIGTIIGFEKCPWNDSYFSFIARLDSGEIFNNAEEIEQYYWEETK